MLVYYPKSFAFCYMILEPFFQFNAQSSSVLPQLGSGVAAQPAGLNNIPSSASLQQQPISVHQSSNQQAQILAGSRDAGKLKLCITITLVNSYPTAV